MMKILKHFRYAALSAGVIGCLVLAGKSPAQQKTSPTLVSIRGISKPSAVYDKLQFMTPGLIREVKVKEGDHVQKGQLLISEDDRIEANQLEALKHEAASTVRIDVAREDMKIKAVQLKRVQELAKDGTANPTEVEEAQLKVSYAEGQMKVAELDRDKTSYEAGRQEIKVQQMKMTSPVDGVVTTLNLHEGEMASPAMKDPAIVIVQNDPLWCEFNLPTAYSTKLKVGDKLDVRHENDADDAWVSGTIKFINAQANAGADAQTVRVELANPKNRDSGMRVWVRLPETVAAPAVAGAASR
jgi:RND family efflux transporter MFP subunit